MVQKHTCTPTFTVVLFTIAKMWKQPNWLLTDEWIKKMWCIYKQIHPTHTHTQDGILLSHQNE